MTTQRIVCQQQNAETMKRLNMMLYDSYSRTSCRLECSLKAAVSEVGCLPWYVQDQNFIDHKHVKSSGNKGKLMIFSGISLAIIAEHAGI